VPESVPLPCCAWLAGIKLNNTSDPSDNTVLNLNMIMPLSAPKKPDWVQLVIKNFSCKV
jgi:hypothetical protein